MLNNKIAITFKEYNALNEALDLEYTRWKRKNVTLRGVNDRQSEDNSGMAKYGRGLYTAFLGNKEMAKEYGDVYFVFGSIPKNPKILKSVNYAEMFLHELEEEYCKEHNLKSRHDFYKETSIEKEMLKKGYDGLIIKGREMVNYKPEKVLYFKNENELYNYYKNNK